MAMKYVLPLLSGFALYSTLYFAQRNGLRGLALKSIASGALPDSRDPLRTVYTDIEPVDKLLTTLATFFWSVVSGTSPELTLHSVAFSGTFGAAWVLVVLEAWRNGNAWTIAAFPMVFGLAAQVFTFAAAAPLYCAGQLATSITATRPSAENIRVPRALLMAIPAIFTVGYMVPSALCLLPVPSMVAADEKQIIIAAWQPWPAYVSVLATAVHVIFSRFTTDQTDSTADGSRSTLRALRRVYFFAFANTAVTHLVALTISLATLAAPVTFKGKYATALHPLRVFGLALPWSSLKVHTIADGVHVFLRWDYIIGSVGILLWAATLYVNAHQAILNRVRWMDLSVKVAGLSLLASPVGAAVWLLWERDELVLHETGGVKPRVTQERKSK